MAESRRGRPMGTFRDISGERIGSLVALRPAWPLDEVSTGYWHFRCDCGVEVKKLPNNLRNAPVSPACGHAGRHQFSRHPSVSYLPYLNAHYHVRWQKGSASRKRCVDCGRKAQDWSYNNADPNEKWGLTKTGHVCAYSEDVSYYEPRCKSCHKRFDLAHARLRAA